MIGQEEVVHAGETETETGEPAQAGAAALVAQSGHRQGGRVRPGAEVRHRSQPPASLVLSDPCGSRQGASHGREAGASLRDFKHTLGLKFIIYKGLWRF